MTEIGIWKERQEQRKNIDLRFRVLCGLKNTNI